MIAADFDALLRRLAALRPATRDLFGRLSKTQRGAARKAVAAVEVPPDLSAEQRWVLARVRGYVCGEEPSSGRWVPPDPSDPMEQLLSAVAAANTRAREAEIARQHRRAS